MTIQLVSYETPEGVRTGLMQDGKVYASRRFATTREVLEHWDDAAARLPGLAAELSARAPVPDARLVAPLPDPRTIFFAGANYRDHVDEMKQRLGLPLDVDPKARGLQPWFSIKAGGPTVVGPGARVARPQGTAMLDWELELAVVIGRRCKDVPRAAAYEVVAGYTVVNDLSARDHVGRAGVADDSPFKWDWVGQKSFDGSCPMGPAITPHAFVGDPMRLAMRLSVNGETMQASNTSRMIFDIADQVAFLSSRVTLMPGDLILTGTPAGVGMARDRFLKAGDVVAQWIENVGEFEFVVE